MAASDSGSSSSSGSDSDSEEQPERHRSEKRQKDKAESRGISKKEKKREKREKRGKKDKKESKDKREKKEKREKRERKRRDKEKERKARHKEKEKLKATASGSSWGKYGIIREGDMYSKQEEFFAWLSEVKGVPQDACGQRELKEHFADFCEDYNTATMPSKKYYSLSTWFAKEQQKAAKRGEAEPQAQSTSFDFEGERQREIQRAREKRALETTSLIAKAMRSGEGLVADMREQEEMKFKMRQAYSVGDTSRARELSDRLDPSRVDAEEIKKKFGSYAPSLSAMGKNAS